jgi:hypothetical protein
LTEPWNEKYILALANEKEWKETNINISGCLVLILQYLFKTRAPEEDPVQG